MNITDMNLSNVHLHVLTVDGVVSWSPQTPNLDFFLATGLTPGEPDREPTEQDMRTRWFPRGEVERMIRDGVITDDSTLAAYLLFTMRE